MAIEAIDPDEAAGPEAISALLIKAMEGLPERCQEAMRLRLTANLFNAEIADRMNISKRTLEVYMFKAFTHLRASYNKSSRGPELSAR